MNSSGTMTHELKCWPVFYRELVAGTKTFELRRNDRNYQQGDMLVIDEWNDATQEYMNSLTLRFEVTHAMYGPIFGLEAGWVILSIKPLL